MLLTQDDCKTKKLKDSMFKCSSPNQNKAVALHFWHQMNQQQHCLRQHSKMKYPWHNLAGIFSLKNFYYLLVTRARQISRMKAEAEDVLIKIASYM